MTLLRAYDHETERLLHAKQEQMDRSLAIMEDEYRKTMKELGFNVLILPAEQDLSEFWRKGYAGHTIDAAAVDRLAESGTTRIRHLLPLIQQEVFWPETRRTVTLVGTRGEVPVVGRGRKEPMLQAVPEGKMILGRQLADDLSLVPGDKVTFLDTAFEILEVRPRKGGVEDATVWVSLEAAQRMLGLEGRINAIEALKCHCNAPEKETIQQEIAALTDEITAAIPGVQAVVRENRVMVRAKARWQARQTHQETIRAWRNQRSDLRREREELAGLVVPLALGGAVVWIAFLALANVRERRKEIGLLRALGVGGMRIFSLFMIKALILGLAGAAVGITAGLVIAASASSSASASATTSEVLFDWSLVWIIAGAPLISALACLMPAVLACRQDPAAILSED